MTKPQYVYVTYILTTPEKVWAALTDAELSLKYWGRSNVSDWKVGSSWSHRLPGEAAEKPHAPPSSAAGGMLGVVRGNCLAR